MKYTKTRNDAEKIPTIYKKTVSDMAEFRNFLDAFEKTGRKVFMLEISTSGLSISSKISLRNAIVLDQKDSKIEIRSDTMTVSFHFEKMLFFFQERDGNSLAVFEMVREEKSVGRVLFPVEKWIENEKEARKEKSPV